MFRGLGKLTWVELKIFMREPMGSISTLLVPAILFVAIGGLMRDMPEGDFDAPEWVSTKLPVFVTMIIALNAVISLTTIVSIYREGGILKRLKSTPLRPQTILTAHVIVKLLLTGVNVITLLILGKAFFSLESQGNLWLFAAAVTLSTIAILSMGFIIASLVPTARFAQLIAGTVLYPLLGLSGLFASIETFPPLLQTLLQFSPLTHAVTLTTGTWTGNLTPDLALNAAALVLTTIACVWISSRVFRWE